MNVVAEFAHALGVVPLLWLAWLQWRGVKREADWWWIAAGFGVSFVADFFPHPLAHQVYSVSQAALIGFALLKLPALVAYVGVLFLFASISIAWRGAGGYDVLLRTVAWGGVAAMAWKVVPQGKAPVLRWTLAVGFAAMLAAWFAFTLAPGFASWGALQLARLGTTAGFCLAASRA